MMSLVKMNTMLASNSFGLSPITNFVPNTFSSRNIRLADGGREREREREMTHVTSIAWIYFINLVVTTGSGTRRTSQISPRSAISMSTRVLRI